jgi:RNA polymerase sigma-70 factor (ECF subfamily)
MPSESMASDEEPSFSSMLEVERRRLFGLCYRLTGSAADAEDVVQHTFERALEHSGRVAPLAFRSWLLRVATNAALDVLRRRKRESYTGVWLPEPIETEDWTALELEADSAASPELCYSSAETLSFAFLIALEALTPKQRAVFVLREVLGHSAREAASVLGISEANARILHHRARRAMKSFDGARRPSAELGIEMRRALSELVGSLLAGDVRKVEALLCEDVRSVTDAGGEFNALRKPAVGPASVARFHLRVARRRGKNARLRFCLVNGLPAVAIEFRDGRPRGAPRVLMRCELAEDGRIRQIHSVLATRKLSHIHFDA